VRFIGLFITFAGLFVSFSVFSQISSGGTPHFLQASVMRAASASFFIEMPAFNLDSVLREDAAGKDNMRSSYKFAHKFYTNIDISDAARTVLPDGTTVKQVGIRSSGAFSINLLLRDFEIPPGGKLFVYSADHSYVVGSFDYRNNSPEKVLPIQPVAGESVIVEYSEPPDAPFVGRFIIAEVNHDYRDFFKVEPVNDTSAHNCMPDAICSDANREAIRSTVLLMIDGTTGCSGSLINNSLDDGRPYLLTANHCLCMPDYHPKPMDFYNNMAGTLVAFFNYNRPVCDAGIRMKGSEEMSLAGASARVIIEGKDIALLEFKNSPPDYYNVYYPGWNRNLTASGTKHTNLHHPQKAIKKYGTTNSALSVVSFPQLDANSFWKVPYWTVGSTAAGSSGSPLFNENLQIIGALTAGASLCTGNLPNGQPDYFSMLGKGWETGDPANQLKTYLDPANKGVVQYSGMDPHQINPIVRMSNADYAGGDKLITSKLNLPNSGFVFGNSNLQTLEFAEEFNVTETVEIFGTYLLIPAMDFSYTSGVTVSVYTGSSSPETRTYFTSFVPKYMNYTTSLGFHTLNKSLNVPTETFVVFETPVTVTNKFFISYSINYSPTAQFCVYNTQFQNALQPNSAWLKNTTLGWIRADAYTVQPVKTSLAINPVVRNKTAPNIDTPVQAKNGFYYERSGRILTLSEPLKQSGQIAVYSIGGQLLEKTQIQPDKTTFILSEQLKGTVGIVKVMDNYFSYTGKIIY